MAKITNADEVAAKLGESFRALAQLSGFSERDVSRAEVGVILKTCAGRVKVATPRAIDRSARIRAVKKLGYTISGGPESVTINAGVRGTFGRTWWRTKNSKFQLAGQLMPNGKFLPANKHFRNRDWADIRDAAMDVEAAIGREVAIAQKSAGLSRQAFVQMADDLGIKLEDVQGGGSLSATGIAKARAAIASNGRGYRNGIGTEVYEEGKGYVATLIDQLPYLYKTSPSHDVVISSTIAGRAEYFSQNMRRGVFDSMQEASRAYPWLHAPSAAT